MEWPLSCCFSARSCFWDLTSPKRRKKNWQQRQIRLAAGPTQLLLNHLNVLNRNQFCFRTRLPRFLFFGVTTTTTTLSTTTMCWYSNIAITTTCSKRKRSVKEEENEEDENKEGVREENEENEEEGLMSGQREKPDPVRRQERWD